MLLKNMTSFKLTFFYTYGNICIVYTIHNVKETIMKDFKKLMFILLLVLSLSMSNVFVYASSSNEISSQEAFMPTNPDQTNEEREPDYIVTFIADKSGNVQYYEEGSESVRSLRATDTVIGAFNFYNMGYDSSKNSQFYEVQFVATCASTTNFLYHTFQAKPTNNSSWFSQTVKHTPSIKRQISDTIYYGYPGTGPSDPKCEVKLSVTIKDGTVYNFSTTLSKPYK